MRYRNRNVRVVLDGQSLQVWQHQQDGLRLAGLQTEISKSFGCSAAILDSFTTESLDDTSVVLIPTRIAPMTPSECDVLREFVERGGGLLLLTNHADWPGHNPHDFTEHDRSIAGLFGLSIERAWFRTRQGTTLMSGDNLNRTHPILSAKGDDGTPIDGIVVNNSTAITSYIGERIVSLPHSMVDERAGISPAGRAFAAAIPVQKGRVVVLADSGFIGSAGTMAPGPGLLDQGSNSIFLINAIRWAAGLL